MSPSYSVSTFMQCDPRLPDGCSRCNIPSSSVCCELCNLKSAQPSHIFERFAPFTMDQNLSQSTSRASRLKNFTTTAVDYQLRRDLDDYRCQKMVELYGPCIARNLGPADIMSDAFLERIASCARYQKILSSEDLKREVPKWWRAQEFAEEVINILHRYGNSSRFPIELQFTHPLFSQPFPRQ